MRIVSFVVYLVEIGYFGQKFCEAEYAASFNVKIFLDRPAEVLYEGLILKFKPVNMDVLPLYIVLMLASPIMLVANRPNKAFVDESPEQARARRVREGVPPAVIESIFAIGAYARGRKNGYDHQHRG